MIRFVDLTEAYWAGDEENMRESPCCAFLDTVTDRFVREDTGGHVYFSDEDIGYIEVEAFERGEIGNLIDRCRALGPGGFWPR